MLIYSASIHSSPLCSTHTRVKIFCNLLLSYFWCRLETARIGFACGPRVSKTGATGAFTNMINMTNMINQMLPLLTTMTIPQTKVTKSQRMKQKLNDRLYKMQKIWKWEQEWKKKLKTLRLEILVWLTKKFNLFLENAYYTINLGEQTDSLKCHKHHIEYHVKGEFHKLIETKEATIVEKLSTDIRLGQKVKVLSSIKK